jgi:PAS domain S-box-containing protein
MPASPHQSHRKDDNPTIRGTVNRLLRCLHNLRISSQLVLAFLTMGMLQITVVTYLAYTSARKYLRAEVAERIQLIAEIKAGEIESYLARHIKGVTDLARSSTVLETFRTLNEAKRLGRQPNPRNSGLARLLPSHQDALPHRTVVLEVRDGTTIRIRQDEQGRLESRIVSDASRYPALVRALSDTRTSVEPQVRFHYSPEVGLQALVTAPVLEQGDLVGVLALIVPTAELDSIMGDLAGLGESGETVLVATRGDSVAILAPTRHDPAAPTHERVALGSQQAVPEQHAAQGIVLQSEVGVDYRGNLVLAATQHVPALGWGLVVKIDAAEAFAPVTDLRVSVAIVGALSIVLLLLVAVALSKLLVTPIGTLVRAIDRFRLTGMLPDLPTRGPAEIRKLGGAFRNMVANLGDTQTRLQESVSILADRNDELAIEIERRRRSEAALKTLTESLEQRVKARTAELEASRSAALESEGRFKLLFEYAPDAYFLHDLEGRFIDGNRASEQLTGYRREELVGKTFGSSGLLPADELPQAARALARSKMGETSDPREYTLNTKDCRRAVVEIRSLPLRLKDQHLVLGIARDVTDRKKAEQSLRDSEQRLKILFEHLPDAYYLAELTGVLVDANRAAERITGYKRDELIGQNLLHWDLLSIKDAPKSAQLLAHSLSGKSTGPDVFDLKRKDGGPCSVELRTYPVRIKDQRLVLGLARDITNRLKAEGEVREREATIRAIVETSQDWIWAIDVDGRHTYSNPAVEHILGYRPDEMVGQSSGQLLHEDDRRIVEAEFPALTAEKRGWSNLLLRWQHRDGSYRYLESTAVPILDANGELSGFRGVDRDVTERLRSEEALRESQKRLSMLVQQTPLGVIEWDLDFRVVDWNPAAEQIFGYPKEEALGRHARELIVPHEVRPHTDEVWRGLLSEKGGRRSTNQNLTKDGHIIHCEWYNTPLVDDAGNVIGVVSLSQNVTDRVQAEQALRRSEAKYRALFEHATYGFYRASVDGRFLAVNPALVTMLGYESAEELLQIELSTELYADPSARDQLIGQHKGTKPIVGAEVEWKRKGGRQITVRLSGRPFHEDDGTLAGFEMLAEDVTHQRALEAQLRQAQKMEAVGQLTGGIAHDFNNLLSVILLNAQLVGSAVEAGEPVLSSDLKDIEAAAQKAAAMTRQLLGFSRRADLKLVSTDLSDVIQGFSTMLRRVLPENIELRVEPDDSAPRVKADAGAVEQMILNLATNARDAMPDGGRLSIELAEQTLDAESCTGRPWTTPGRYVRIAVSDTGVGMDRDTQSRVFEPFFTTKPVGVGTGLGLAMVYGLTKQHGGFVHLYSEVGRGTTIRLYFPVADQDMTRGDSADGNEAKRRSQGGHETILLVEDEAALRDVAKQVLERSGYTVVVAADGSEALRAYRDNPDRFDLVISDLVMPNMGGAELVQALKYENETQRMLLVSGYSGRDAGARRAVDPLIPFLEKPWRLEQLLQKVRQTLDEDPNGAAKASAAMP